MASAAGAKIAEAYVEINAKNSGLLSGLKQAESATRKAAANMQTSLKAVGKGLDSMGSGLSRFGSRISGIGGRMTAAVTLPIVGLGAYAVKAAADVYESEDLFERAFGDMADSARAWSEEFASAIKRSAYPIRQYASTFQLMLSSMGFTQSKAMDMSETMTQLAYDMQSAFNIPTMEQAFMELRSGLTGETEPLRKYGVVITEAAIQQYAWATGIAEGGKKLTEQQKVVARYGFILASLSQIHNNAADTANSAQNRMRSLQDRFKDLAVRVGNMLLPVLERLITFVNKLLDKWDALSPEMKRWGLVAAGAAALAGPLLMILGGVFSMLGSVAGIAGSVVGALSSIAGAIGGITLEGGILLATLTSLGLQLAAIVKGWKAGGLRGAGEEWLKLGWDSALEGFQKGGIVGALKGWFSNAFKVGAGGIGDLFTALFPDAKAKLGGAFNSLKTWALERWNQIKGMFKLGGEEQPPEKQPTQPGMTPASWTGVDEKAAKKALDEYIDQLDERYDATKEWADKAGKLIEKFYDDQKRYDEEMIQRQRQAMGFTSAEEMYRKAALAGQRERLSFDEDFASLEARKEAVGVLKRLLPSALAAEKTLAAQLEIMKRYKGAAYG